MNIPKVAADIAVSRRRRDIGGPIRDLVHFPLEGAAGRFLGTKGFTPFRQEVWLNADSSHVLPAISCIDAVLQVVAKLHPRTSADYSRSLQDLAADINASMQAPHGPVDVVRCAWGYIVGVLYSPYAPRPHLLEIQKGAR